MGIPLLTPNCNVSSVNDLGYNNFMRGSPVSEIYLESFKTKHEMGLINTYIFNEIINYDNIYKTSNVGNPNSI